MPPLWRALSLAFALVTVPTAASPGEAGEVSVCRAAPAPLPPSEWFRAGVVYGAVPPLFGPEPLRAVTARLDSLKSLGVDAIWLSPILATDVPGEISYAITDYFRIRPDFGTPSDLRTLVREAHARGMKVLMDLVPNHTSDHHPFFLDAQRRGRASPYYRFYERDAAGRPLHYFDWNNLENLDYGDPAVRRYITLAFLHWVRDFDIDGFRVDAAWGVKERRPGFWPELTRALRREKPPVFLIAEASARDPYYVRSGFDAAYDWTGELGHWAWAQAFDDLSQVGPRLHEALTAPGTPMARVARFLENNDTGDRFITRHGPAAARVATVLLYTLPGIPVLFTGEEIGAEYRPYEISAPLAWEDRSGLRALHARLAALREQMAAFESGDFQGILVPDHPSAYAFVRDAGGGALALVVLNFGPPAALHLPVSGSVRERLLGSGLEDAVSGAAVQLRASPGGVDVEIGGSSAQVIAPRACR